MDTTADQIFSMEDMRYLAMIDGDILALERMSADDLAYTHSSGELDDRTAYLAGMRAGKFRYRLIERSEAKVTLVDGAALVTGRIRLDVLFVTGPRVLDSRFLSVWVRVVTGWRHLAWHSTSVPGSA